VIIACPKRVGDALLVVQHCSSNYQQRIA